MEQLLAKMENLILDNNKRRQGQNLRRRLLFLCVKIGKNITPHENIIRKEV